MIKFSVGTALIETAKQITVDRLGVEGSFITLDLSGVERAEDKRDVLMLIAEEAREVCRDEGDPERRRSLAFLASLVASKTSLVRDNDVRDDNHISQAAEAGSHSLPSESASITDSSPQHSDDFETETEEVENGNEAQTEGESEREAEAAEG